ncbi:MAG: ParA family protein [Proteobacteria bacterium]|nr:ParA family protein [Pseudomonadota bacterium]
MSAKFCHVISVVNQKGGVGKTTTALNLASALAMRGKKVLLMDLDSQCNATTGIGVKRELIKRTTYDILVNGGSIGSATLTTVLPTMWIVPGSLDLAAVDVELAATEGREYILAQALKGHKSYDYIIIDCPPSLGLLTVNSLVASDSVIVPVQCEFFALEGLVNLVNTMRMVQRNLNSALGICGILLTMVDSRSRLTREVSQEIRREFGPRVFSTTISRNVKLPEAVSYGVPVALYDPKSSGAIAYASLAGEVIEKPISAMI